MLADAGFESGSVAPYVYSSTSPYAAPPVTKTGWAQCTVRTIAPGITFTGGISGTGTYTAATPPPVSTYTPTPGSTPAAVEVAAGAPAPAGSNSPTPLQSTAPVYAGSEAAQFGQLFNNYNAGNWYYNGLCQQVTVPANGANFSAEVFEDGNEGNTYVEDVVAVLDTTGSNMIGLVWMENEESATSAGDSAYRQIPGSGGTIDLSAYAGQTIDLFIGMWTKAGSSSNSLKFSSYWWVDNAVMFPGAGTYNPASAHRRTPPSLMKQRTRTH
jgi:hypothetical protein